jgi:hypothetical protein
VFVPTTLRGLRGAAIILTGLLEVKRLSSFFSRSDHSDSGAFPEACSLWIRS